MIPFSKTPKTHSQLPQRKGVVPSFSQYFHNNFATLFDPIVQFNRALPKSPECSEKQRQIKQQLQLSQTTEMRERKSTTCKHSHKMYSFIYFSSQLGFVTIN